MSARTIELVRHHTYSAFFSGYVTQEDGVRALAVTHKWGAKTEKWKADGVSRCLRWPSAIEPVEGGAWQPGSVGSPGVEWSSGQASDRAPFHLLFFCPPHFSVPHSPVFNRGSSTVSWDAEASGLAFPRGSMGTMKTGDRVQFHGTRKRRGLRSHAEAWER